MFEWLYLWNVLFMECFIYRMFYIWKDVNPVTNLSLKPWYGLQGKSSVCMLFQVCSIYGNYGILYMKTSSRSFRIWKPWRQNVLKWKLWYSIYGNSEILYMESMTWRSIHGNNDVAITWHLLGIQMAWWHGVHMKSSPIMETTYVRFPDSTKTHHHTYIHRELLKWSNKIQVVRFLHMGIMIYALKTHYQLWKLWGALRHTHGWS